MADRNDLEELKKTVEEMKRADGPPEAVKMLEEMIKTRDLQAELAAAEVGGTREVLNETPWDKLTVDQKLERMRGILKDLQHTLDWQSQRFHDLVRQLATLDEHTHADGRVMIPVASKLTGRSYGEKACQEQIDGWF